MTEFLAALEETADRVTVALDALIPRPDGPEARLMSAMRYAALGGSERLRPFFVVHCGRLFDVDERSLLRAAAALECVHTYAQIHTHLPSMDDTDFEGGRPTLHRAYDEATATLAGDALLSLGFEILCHPDTHADPRVRAELALRLADAAGPRGVAGGLMIERASRRDVLDIAALTRMQRMKTGALILFASEIGAVMVRASDDCFQALAGFAHDLGLAYQIADELDEPDDERAAADDAAPRRARFRDTLGEEGARGQARLLAAQAKAHLDLFGERAVLLRDAVDFVLDRQS